MNATEISAGNQDEQPEQNPGLNPATKEWILTQAFVRLQQRQVKAALVLLKGLRVLAPDDPDVYSIMSYALLQADQPEECLRMVDRYMQCVPPNTDTTEISWIQGRAKVRLEKANDDSGDQAES